uniref:NS1 n=1 Tax=uncultured densovirus TaxID=748192 RepID=A0A7L7YTF5_9VIRU|nr:NS1 [uncultured densovirus]
MSNDGTPGELSDVGHGGDDVQDEGCGGGDSQSTEAVVEDSPGVSADVHTVSGEPRPKRQRLEDGNQRSIKDFASVAKPGAESEQRRCARIFNELQGSSGYYLSDVIECVDDEQAASLADYLRRGTETYKRGLLLVCIDSKTVQIVHDCSLSNNSCRCTWFKKAETLYGLRRRGRSFRRRPLCNKLQISDIENILKYFTKGKRRTQHIKIGGRVERVPNEDSTMALKGLEGVQGLEGQGEQSTQDTDYELRRELFETADERAGRYRRGTEAVSEKRRSKKGSQQVRRMEAIVNLCKNHPMSPVEAIVSHPKWLKHEDLKFLGADNKDVSNAFNNWTKQLCTWTLEDFNVLYSDEECQPIFGAGYGNADSYYFDVETSVNVLNELLKFQMGDEEYCHAFMSTLYDIVERKVPKMNTLLIKSPPSSGKNYFFDCIKDYFLNVGHLCRANKHNNFAFQDAEGRRLILWNEPNYSPEFVESLKELLGGDSTNVSVKHKAEAPVYRTPIIMLTNSHLSIINDPAFKDRVKVYYWKKAQYLADYDKKPHPLATYKLFKMYNLVE